jgi:hypothetical protein
LRRGGARRGENTRYGKDKSVYDQLCSHRFWFCWFLLLLVSLFTGEAA